MNEPRTTARRSPRRPAATILDVARRAGVSTATVSRALATPDRVADGTRARVTAAIAETGFTPNASARNLRARSTKIVLALVPGMTNTFFNPILNAIEDTLSAAGYGMLIGDTRNSVAKEAHYTRVMLAGQVDGAILFTGHLPRGEDAALAAERVPIALVCNEIPGDASHSVFDVANRKAAQKAVAYLIEEGHRRIGHIAGHPRNVEARERLRGYADALRDAGIDFDQRLVWGDSFRFDTGVDATKAYLSLAERPTAIFAAADDAAIGFIRTLRDAGVRTPQDVSVVGFDDIDYASVIDPPLTTMRQPRAELGRRAAEALLERMTPGGAELPPIRARLDCDLIVRDSVRPMASAEKPGAGRLPRRRRATPLSPAGGRAVRAT